MKIFEKGLVLDTPSTYRSNQGADCKARAFSLSKLGASSFEKASSRQVEKTMGPPAPVSEGFHVSDVLVGDHNSLYITL